MFRQSGKKTDLEFEKNLKNHIAVTCDCARLMNVFFSTYIVSYTEEGLESLLKKIEDKEHEADHLASKMHAYREKTFITPIDKEDIKILTDELDHITDSLKQVMRFFTRWQIMTGREEVGQFCCLIVIMTEIVQKLIDSFSDGRPRHNGQSPKKIWSFFPRLKPVLELEKILKIYVEPIKAREDEADDLLDSAIKKISGEADAGLITPKEITAWRDIFEALEDTTDHCEHVVNAINSIVMKM